MYIIWQYPSRKWAVPSSSGLHESGSPEAKVRVAEDVDKMQEVMKGMEMHHKCMVWYGILEFNVPLDTV